MTRGLPNMAAWTAPSHWRTRPALAKGIVMHTLRIISGLLIGLAMVIGSAVAATAASDEAQPTFGQVTGTVAVHAQAPGGSWEIVDGVSQYREYPVSASGLTFTDARLNGELESTWNWDVHGSGSLPVPSWGTLRMGTDDAAWEGPFTGIKRVEGGPADLRASLIGDGGNSGLCTTVDILVTGTSTGDTWIVDGVIYPC
jgi:hypothetical protein